LIEALKRQQQQGGGLFEAGGSAVNLHDLAQVAWSVAHLGHLDDQLHSAILRQALLLLQTGDLPGISKGGTLQDFE